MKLQSWIFQIIMKCLKLPWDVQQLTSPMRCSTCTLQIEFTKSTLFYCTQFYLQMYTLFIRHHSCKHKCDLYITCTNGSTNVYNVIDVAVVNIVACWDDLVTLYTHRADREQSGQGQRQSGWERKHIMPLVFMQYLAMTS